ncbi:hypothetical protein EC880221_4682, partial [Escherichia coli 88.0221]
MPADLHR